MNSIRWHYFTELAPSDIDPDRPQYDNGIDFVLTPQERDRVAIHKCQIREMRDRQNERDMGGAK